MNRAEYQSSGRVQSIPCQDYLDHRIESEGENNPPSSIPRPCHSRPPKHKMKDCSQAVSHSRLHLHSEMQPQQQNYAVSEFKPPRDTSHLQSVSHNKSEANLLLLLPLPLLLLLLLLLLHDLGEHNVHTLSCLEFSNRQQRSQSTQRNKLHPHVTHNSSPTHNSNVEHSPLKNDSNINRDQGIESHNSPTTRSTCYTRHLDPDKARSSSSPETNTLNAIHSWGSRAGNKGLQAKVGAGEQEIVLVGRTREKRR